MSDELSMELAHRMPWLDAEYGSWWLITWTIPGRQRPVTDRIATALVDWQHPLDGKAFAAFGGTGTDLVSADRIIRARRLVLVHADDPATAVAEIGQDYLDAARVAGGGESA